MNKEAMLQEIYEASFNDEINKVAKKIPSKHLNKLKKALSDAGISPTETSISTSRGAAIMNIPKSVKKGVRRGQQKQYLSASEKKTVGIPSNLNAAFKAPGFNVKGG